MDTNIINNPDDACDDYWSLALLSHPTLILSDNYKIIIVEDRLPQLLYYIRSNCHKTDLPSTKGLTLIITLLETKGASIVT